MIDVDNLVIEVTRKCNLECEHCMRGDAENGTMDISHVTILFKQIEYVSTITLTGGEPLLCPEILGQVLDRAKKYGVIISNFYIVTNGTIVSDKVLRILMDWYLYCDDNEMTSVEVSNDVFHDVDAIQENYKRLSCLRFVSKRNEKDDYNYEWHDGSTTIIPEGHGENFGGFNHLSPDYVIVDDWGARLTVQDAAIYLNVKGSIIKGCDFSYDSQEEEENILCNVKDFTTCIESIVGVDTEE